MVVPKFATVQNEGVKLIDDHTLVALTIMIAESRPEEREMMITVVMIVSIKKTNLDFVGMIYN